MTQTKKRLQQGQPNQWRICGDSHLTPVLNHLRGQSEQGNFTMLNAKASNHSLCSDAQKKRVIDYLQQNQTTGLNRYEADVFLNVCQLAPRIKDLRDEGHQIIRVDEKALDLSNRPHNGIARYFWQGYSVPQNNTVKTEAVVL